MESRAYPLGSFFILSWEQRELWELTIWDKKFNEVEAEKQPKIIKYPYVLADVFSKIEDASGDVRLLSTGNYIGYTTDEKAGKNLCVGEVVAIPWGGVPNIKYYKGKFVTADNRIATSNDTETLGNRFLSLYLEHSLAFLQSIYRGASIKHPSMNDVLSMQISIPHIQEQREIETWFANLDNLITLHQRKYDKLTNVKKSMLEKMFPKNGSNVPEIRFKGFTEAWEQRKLGNVANYRRGSFPQPYGKSEWYDGDGAMPFVQVADVSDEMNLVENTKQKISMLAQPMSVFAGKNTVLVTLQGSIGRVAITQYGAFVDRTVLIFEKYKEKIDTTFWAYIVKQKFIDEARKAPGGTIKTITKEALSDFDLSIPNYKEQQQIGTFFKQLDNLITLHQRELEKLKNIKKSCLENMFV